MHYIFLLLFCSTLAWSEVSVSVGAGKGILDKKGTPFERVAVVGYQFNPWADVFIRPEAGYFEDLSGSGKSSYWVAPLAGVKASSLSGAELHIGMGPGYLQNPDSTLGGHFQFSLEGGVGLYDGKTYIGLAWKHLSSAGIEMPNQGRDFIVIQLRK